MTLGVVCLGGRRSFSSVPHNCFFHGFSGNFKARELLMLGIFVNVHCVITTLSSERSCRGSQMAYECTLTLTYAVLEL